MKTNDKADLDLNDFLFGEIEKFPSLYSKAYTNYDEIKEEILRNYADLVVNDFPWDERIATLINAAGEHKTENLCLTK